MFFRWEPPGCQIQRDAESDKNARAVLIWRFPKMEIPQNGWFIVENPSING
jgi:hypothetical protein